MEEERRALCARGLPGMRPLPASRVDPQLFAATALAAVFRRRWQIELNFDDIKTTLRMNHPACRSADKALRMVNMYQCAYNLIRAHIHAAGASLYRMSFTAAARLLASTPAGPAPPRPGSPPFRELLLTLIGQDALPLRPGRHEPRAIKRGPSPHPLLTAPRHEMNTIPHRKKYRRHNPSLTAIS